MQRNIEKKIHNENLNREDRVRKELDQIKKLKGLSLKKFNHIYGHSKDGKKGSKGKKKSSTLFPLIEKDTTSTPVLA